MAGFFIDKNWPGYIICYNKCVNTLIIYLEVNMNLHEIQKEVWKNKVNRKFNTTDVGKEIILLTEELGELAKAYKHSNQMPAKEIDNKDEMIDAVGDMMIYNIGLCEMFGVESEKVLSDIIENNKIRTHSGQMKVRGK